VCIGLGYGSGSGSDDERDDDNPSLATGRRQSPAAESSSDDDDEQLLESIRRKKMEFERKMRELEERENGAWRWTRRLCPRISSLRCLTAVCLVCGCKQSSVTLLWAHEICFNQMGRGRGCSGE